MPTRPFESMIKTVEVAKPAVVVEMRNMGAVCPADPVIESLAPGEVVPMPM